jgi:flagellar hook-associated protein 2
MRITLHEEKDGSTDLVPTHADDINVTFTRDATDAVSRIKGFIEAYNSIIKKVESLAKERKSSGEVSYGPLTDEEKSVMSEKQIAEWEAIAKKGILKNDNGLQRLASSLRSAFYDSVQSVGLSPSEIGLTTGSFFDGTGGQIFIDEDKLKAALEDNPEKVSEIFAGTGGNKGLLWRMNDLMGDYVNKSQTHTMLSLENSIKRANEQMLKMQDRMYAEEDKLYRQFAAMETAMSKLQSQGDWFTSMLGGGK